MRMQINYQLHRQQHILWVCTLAGETMFSKYELPVLTGLNDCISLHTICAERSTFAVCDTHTLYVHAHIVFVQVCSIVCANEHIQQIMHFNVLLAKLYLVWKNDYPLKEACLLMGSTCHLVLTESRSSRGTANSGLTQQHFFLWDSCILMPAFPPLPPKPLLKTPNCSKCVRLWCSDMGP